MAIDRSKNSVTLSWEPPNDCGRGKILGYMLEYQKAGDEEWLQVNQTPEACPKTSYKIINLEEGMLYRFRIKAVNVAGQSDPADVPEPVLAQDRLG